MSAALKLTFISDPPRSLYLVSPPLPPKRPEPPTVPQLRVPKAAPIPRIDPVSDRPVDELNDREMAQSSFTMLMGLNQQLPVMARDIKDTKAGLQWLDAKIGAVDDKVDNLVDRVERIETERPGPELAARASGVARPSPSGDHLVVEVADYVRSEERSMEAMRERDSLRIHVGTLDQKLAAETRSRELAEAAASGAEKALRNRSDAWKLYAAIFGPIAVIVGAIFGLATILHK